MRGKNTLSLNVHVPLLRLSILIWLTEFSSAEALREALTLLEDARHRGWDGTMEKRSAAKDDSEQ